jgi:transposase-like protein
MTTISFARHQFPPDIIRHAVWLYLRFTLSFRDVEDLLAERGLDVSYETIRRWERQTRLRKATQCLNATATEAQTVR